MIRVKPSGEGEMVHAFLKMELSSERFQHEICAILARLQLDAQVILNGDPSSEAENRQRKEVLGEFRGYGGNSGLFENFPADVRWTWSLFDRGDLPKIKYINYSYWNELSRRTGSPVVAAQTISSGKTVYGVPNDGFWRAARDLKNGASFPPLIMLTDMSETDFIMLEGHKRITAYALAPERFHGISVLLGYCGVEALRRWYGEMP